MKTGSSLALALLLVLCCASAWLQQAVAQERIPPLEVVPASVTESTDKTPGDVSAINGIGRQFYGSAAPCPECASVTPAEAQADLNAEYVFWAENIDDLMKQPGSKK